MEATKPIELLKTKLTELKSNPRTEPALMLEYEKAILILELMRSDAFDDIINRPNGSDNLDSTKNELKKESKSYYDRFMESQKNKNNKSK